MTLTVDDIKKLKVQVIVQIRVTVSLICFISKFLKAINSDSAVSFLQELRDELQKRNLDTGGLKAALTERLEEAVKADTLAEPDAEQNSTATLTNGSASGQSAVEAPAEEKVGHLLCHIINESFA